MSSIDLNKFKNLNVIIIKNTSQNKIVRPDDSFEATNLFEYLHKNHWYICNPETDDFYTMAYILMNARTIITGYGGISCCNQIFYNLDANIIGFIPNKTHNDIRIVNTSIIQKNSSYSFIYDVLCNGYFYHRMQNVILSPLSITHKNVSEFFSVVSEVALVPFSLSPSCM